MCAVKSGAVTLLSLDYLEQKGNLSTLQSTPIIFQEVKNGCQKSWINRIKKKKKYQGISRGTKAERSFPEEHKEAGVGGRNTPFPLIFILLCSTAFVHIRDGN